ncbi:TraR/DksA family transcriptional regulator [Antarctobacter jejuensis]|uniref:TraR/DksA family transcriptional regulator n=1 Tax=Antarctobacter jejuensis TaxID=1439938 RepID=UPI003FD0BD11
MDGSETNRFYALIRNRITELDQEDRLGRQGQSTVELDQQAVGRLSRQDALLHQSMAKATQARRDGLRRALLAALYRLDAGEFGYCEDCGESIAPRRLELDPTAMRCVACASG